jgi:hypothetical protein
MRKNDMPQMETRMFQYEAPDKQSAPGDWQGIRHSIASLPGAILRLSKSAGSRILRAASPASKKAIGWLIEERLRLTEKKLGLHCHFANEAEQLMLSHKKEHLLLGVLNLQLYYATHCSDVSMIIVRLVEEAGKAHLTMNIICTAPCESLSKSVAGFSRMRNRVQQTGGSLQLNYEAGYGGTLDLVL